MGEVRWAPQAADDLDAICEFIARDSPEMAAIFADRVLRATEQLSKFPRSGRIVPELKISAIRELIVGSYRVIYRVLRESDTQLLTIHHGARPLDRTKFAALR